MSDTWQSRKLSLRTKCGNLSTVSWRVKRGNLGTVSLRAKRGNLGTVSLRAKRGNPIQLNILILTQSPQKTIESGKDSEQQKNNQQPGIGSKPFIEVIPDQ